MRKRWESVNISFFMICHMISDSTNKRSHQMRIYQHLSQILFIYARLSKFHIHTFISNSCKLEIHVSVSDQ